MMRMTFFWTPDIGEFFFKGIEINTIVQLALLCGVVALFAILYEGIKVYSAYARARTAREQIAAVSCAPSESANLLITDNNRQKTFSQRFCRLFNETVVFFFHNSIGYAIMLSVMVYSGWLFVAVILGMGLGYFLFGHIAMKVNMESIQSRTAKVICSPTCPEAGTSGIASKNPSTCQSDSAQTSCCDSPSVVTSVTSCYENTNISDIQSSGGCNENSAMPSNNKTTVETVNEESCSCRL